jgi:ribosomal protection tetracycline resistance protein
VRLCNLGILAHVDAGKTSLTERLLFTAGVIDGVGSVDAGSTQTDSLALERQRGITIKSAVVSFVLGDTTINLIDTPRHPDFIAEVERVLGVLDGAVLVISAVEGVQPQTRVLMRTLQRLRIPTLLFVNKLDRGGAHDQRVLQAISDRLTPAVVAMGSRPGSAPATPGSSPTAPTTTPSLPGWPSSWPTTTRPCWPPSSTTRRPSPTGGSAASWPPRPAGPWSTRSTSGRRSPAPGSRR